MRKLFICLLLFTVFRAEAQKDIKGRSERLPILNFNYALTAPAGNMKERFGLNSNLGASIFLKQESNWIFGLEGNFLFGRQVKEDQILKHISSEAGEVFDQDSKVAQILLFERGFTTQITAGHLFNVIGPNPNSGLLVKAGIGFMQHKIRVEHQNNRIPQLEGEYAKGYDRLSNGLMLSQYLGYLHMSNSKLSNFTFGFEISEGFTRSRRSFNFDTRSADTRKRLDILYGFRVGWCLSIYKRTANNYYYN